MTPALRALFIGPATFRELADESETEYQDVDGDEIEDRVMPPEYSDPSEDDSDNDCMYDVITLQIEFSVY